MVKVSKKSSLMPASAIRKLVPFADAAQNDGIKVYHLNVGAPDIKSPECALEAVRKNTLDHVSYTNSAGLPELRKGLAEKYYRSIGIEVSVPEIIITVAGSEAVNLALQIACDEGDELIVIEPFYTNYNTFCFESGIILKAVHTDIESGFKVPPIEEFEKLVTPRTKAILISNLCGCRVGCIVSHNKEVMEAAMKYAQSRLCPPVYGQLASIGALDTPQSYFTEVRNEYVARRDYAISRLNAMEGVYSPTPMGAFYTIARIPVDDAEKFAKWMLTDFRLDGQTTMVTPAKSFYKTPGFGADQIRLAYVLGVPELEKAFDALEAGLKEYPGRTV